MNEENPVLVSRLLRVDLTEKEMLESGKSLAEAAATLAQLEGEKTKIAAEFKARITKQQQEVLLLSSRVKSGYDHRDVDCAVRFNRPKQGQKTLIRTDLNEVVAVEPMTQEEMQRWFDGFGSNENKE